MSVRGFDNDRLGMGFQKVAQELVRPLRGAGLNVTAKIEEKAREIGGAPFTPQRWQSNGDCVQHLDRKPSVGDGVDAADHDTGDVHQGDKRSQRRRQDKHREEGGPRNKHLSKVGPLAAFAPSNSIRRRGVTRHRKHSVARFTLPVMVDDQGSCRRVVAHLMHPQKRFDARCDARPKLRRHTQAQP